MKGHFRKSIIGALIIIIIIIIIIIDIIIVISVAIISYTLVLKLFKAAVRKFCFFVAISVWKPGIAAQCGIIFLAWGCVSARMNLNVLRSMCVSLSVTAPVWIVYLVITDSSLRLAIYEQNKNFHRILPSEQVTSLPRLFWSTE